MSLKITIEGGQGSGKTRLLKILEVILANHGYKVTTEESDHEPEYRDAIKQDRRGIVIETKQTKG